MTIRVWTTRIGRKEVRDTIIRFHTEDNETFFDLPSKGTYKLKGVVSELMAETIEGRRISVRVMSETDPAPADADVEFHGNVLMTTWTDCLVSCGGLMVRFATTSGANVAALTDDAALHIAITLL